MAHQKLKEELIAERAEITLKRQEAKKSGDIELCNELKKKYYAISNRISYYTSVDTNPEFIKKKSASTSKAINKAFDNSKKYRELMNNLSSIVSSQ